MWEQQGQRCYKNQTHLQSYPHLQHPFAAQQNINPELQLQQGGDLLFADQNKIIDPSAHNEIKDFDANKQTIENAQDQKRGGQILNEDLNIQGCNRSKDLVISMNLQNNRHHLITNPSKKQKSNMGAKRQDSMQYQQQITEQQNQKSQVNYVHLVIPKNITYTQGFAHQQVHNNHVQAGLTDSRLHPPQYQTLQPNIHIHHQNVNNPYSRENMQQMNKKCREIRSSRYGPHTGYGLYDIQNDRREGPTNMALNFGTFSKNNQMTMRTISSLSQYGRRDAKGDIRAFSNHKQKNQRYGQKVNHGRQSSCSITNQQDIQPFIQSLKKFSERNKISQSSEAPKRKKLLQQPENHQFQQPFLRSKSHPKEPIQNLKKKKSQSHRSPQKSTSAAPVDIFLPQKQSESGHILYKFQSKLKKKCIEDNLHVMATLLKKKIKVLQKKDMMNYLKKIMNRNGGVEAS